METIKYEVTSSHRCITQCPFCTLGEFEKVGAFECTERCPAFVSHDMEAQTVVCNPEKVTTVSHLWSDAMRKKYPELAKRNELKKK